MTCSTWFSHDFRVRKRYVFGKYMSSLHPDSSLHVSFLAFLLIFFFFFVIISFHLCILFFLFLFLLGLMCPLRLTGPLSFLPSLLHHCIFGPMKLRILDSALRAFLCPQLALPLSRCPRPEEVLDLWHHRHNFEAPQLCLQL